MRRWCYLYHHKSDKLRSTETWEYEQLLERERDWVRSNKISNRVSYVTSTASFSVKSHFLLRRRRFLLENQIKIKLPNSHSIIISRSTKMKCVFPKDALYMIECVFLSPLYVSNERMKWFHWCDNKYKNTNNLTDENECECANVYTCRMIFGTTSLPSGIHPSISFTPSFDFNKRHWKFFM